jgi:hypothetical protein
MLIMLNKGFLVRKTLALVCAFALLASFPVSVSANPGTAAFTLFAMNSTVVDAGQAITFTIRTSGANFVFADIGGTLVAAAPQSQPDHTGQMVWALTATPATSTTIIVYANSINAVEGASTISIPVTVNFAAQPQQPTPQAPQATAHRIYSITEVEATQPQSVSLRITTDAAAGSVWVIPEPGRYLQATRVAGESGVWELNYRPRTFAPHQVQVHANHVYIIDPSMASETFAVNLLAPYVPPVNPPGINRVSASPTNISRGDRTTITVRTNTQVEHVWMEVNGRRVDARRAGSTATNRNWEAEVRPDSTQTIRVYANATNTTQGADTDSVRVTVREFEDARITSASPRQSNIRQGERTIIDVRTNEDTRYVWAMVGNTRVNGRRDGGSGNNRDWTIEVQPNRAGESNSIRVYASSTNHERDADTRTVNIFVGQPW